MSFFEFIYFVIGTCVGYGVAAWARLPWWLAAVVALFAGIGFVVGSILIRLKFQSRR